MNVAEFDKFISDESRWGMALSGTDAIYHLERKFSQLIDVPFSLCMSNATMALWAIWQALGINGGEIITSPLSWGGSIAGLLQTDNQPIFVDIHPDTLCIDSAKIEEAITPKTKAILSVDVFGYPSFGEDIRKIADDHGLYFIQDCAQSFGAYEGKFHTGHFADAAVYSLGYGKSLFGGEGAVIVTPHRDLYEILVYITQHPLRQKRDIPAKPVNVFFWNLRIHPLSAIWADKCFDSALEKVEQRREEFTQLINILMKNNFVQSLPPLQLKKYKPNYHCCAIIPKSKGLSKEWSIENYEIELKPLKYKNLLYQWKYFADITHKEGWQDSIKCPVAEEQILTRKEMTFKLKTCI